MTHDIDLSTWTIDEIRERGPARLALKHLHQIIPASRTTIYRWREDGIIPGEHKVGKISFWCRDAVCDWLDSISVDKAG